MAELTITIMCKDCGEELSALSKSGTLKIEINVIPCAVCKNSSWIKGYRSGYDSLPAVKVEGEE